jgi:uncharacterized membrane protein YkoI
MYLFLVLALGISEASQAETELSPRQIQALVKSKQILSLTQLKSMHPAYFSGRLLNLEVEQKRSEIVYELEFIDHSGRVFKIKLNARTGKPIPSHRKSKEEQPNQEKHKLNREQP